MFTEPQPCIVKDITKTMSSSRSVNLENGIPLADIRMATEDFNPRNLIGSGASVKVYKGKLSDRPVVFKRFDLSSTGDQGKKQVRDEVELMSSFNHKNIIGFIGYCDEDNEMIAVFEYTMSGSLQDHLHDPNKRRFLTWAHRLEMCIGAAKGLEYLHSGLGEDMSIIHRDINSAHISLDDKLEAKISGFGMSLLVNRNQLLQVSKAAANFYLDPFYKESKVGRTVVYTDPFGAAGTNFYLDPVYKETGVLNTESDVYSFGIVLFEVLSGMLAYVERVGGDGQPQRLINLVRRYYDDGAENLVDPLIKDQINFRSLIAFKDIAYECVSWNLKDRPTMNEIVKRIEILLDDIQKNGEASTITIPSYLHKKLEGFRIPLQEILLATRHFDKECVIGEGGFGRVYKGQLFKDGQNYSIAVKRLARDGYQGKHEFREELQMISSFRFKNIIAFIGYCDEDSEIMIIYEYAVNGSLDSYLHDSYKKRCLTWVQRLQICLGAARGFEYLHSGLPEKVIHRDIKSSNILLDENFEAKVCDFGLSLVVDRNQPQIYGFPVGTPYYVDPVYRESGMVNTELDVYSFGVVLLEMMSGTLAYRPRTIGDDQPQTLVNLVRRYYDDGLENLVDPYIRDQINIHSLRAFTNIAYRCISFNLKDRPTMKRLIRRIEEALLDIQDDGVASTITTRCLKMENHERFLIPLEEINMAVGDLSRKKPIGGGGFGVVYKGQLSEQWDNSIVAIKYLDPKGHQGDKEFRNELKLLSSFNHPNIIPFVGYCDQGTQMIIVSKHATNGSLDANLKDSKKRSCLPWAQRLRICLGAAKGLDYLHSGLGKANRVIHRDVKSGNILLDEHMEAKICDFGLSKEGPRNQQVTQLYTKAAGTNFYIDPAYSESGILNKESDVYSFGVVLFEILSGMLAYQYSSFEDGDPQLPLINLVRRYYHAKPEKLIDPVIKDEIDSRSFHTFKELALQCISRKPEERPTMDTIIDKIEDAMEFQGRPKTRMI